MSTQQQTFTLSPMSTSSGGKTPLFTSELMAGNSGYHDACKKKHTGNAYGAGEQSRKKTKKGSYVGGSVSADI